MISNQKEDNGSILPDLPEIPLNVPANKPFSPAPEKKLPILPDYPQNINKISVIEAGDDLYNEPIFGMEKSNFSAPVQKDASMIKTSTFSQNNPYSFKAANFKTSEIIPDKNYIKKNNEVFVKVKKFEKAILSFDEVKHRIEEIKKDIEKAKKIIKEETQELESWENELIEIKKSLEDIDKNLFTEISN